MWEWYTSKDGALARRFSDLGFDSRSPSYWALRVPPPTPWSFLPAFALREWDSFSLPTRYEAQIDLPPGGYNLAMVLGDRENFGRVEVPLNIEPYDGTQLGLSSVVMSNRQRNAAVAAQESAAFHLAPRYVPLVSEGVQITPSASLRFKHGQRLITYFEVYEPLLLKDSATKVWAHLKLVDTESDRVEEDFPPVDVAPYAKPASWVIPVSRTLKPRKGAYRLEVQATDSAGRSTVVRTANFTVE